MIEFVKDILMQMRESDSTRDAVLILIVGICLLSGLLIFIVALASLVDSVSNWLIPIFDGVFGGHSSEFVYRASDVVMCSFVWMWLLGKDTPK